MGDFNVIINEKLTLNLGFYTIRFMSCGGGAWQERRGLDVKAFSNPQFYWGKEGLTIRHCKFEIWTTGRQ